MFGQDTARGTLIYIYKCLGWANHGGNPSKGTLSRISSINLASHQRHQTSPWARVTRSKPKRGRIRLLETAKTKLLMAIVRSRNSQVWTLLEVVPLKQLVKLRMMEELVTLDGANSSDKCVNTRYTSATVSCRGGTLSTPSLGGGLQLSALDTGRSRKKNQLL